MGKIQFLGKLVFTLCFIVGLVIVVKYADTIRGIMIAQFGLTTKSVAGAHTSLEEDVKKDVQKYIQDVKENVMNIKVKDVMGGVSRLGKIGKDAQGVKEYIQEQLQHSLKLKAKSEKLK